MEKKDLKDSIHLGENIKCLMRAFRLRQNDLAQRSGYSESQLSNVLRKAEIDNETLERIAKGLDNGVTPDMIRAYCHEDTVGYIINNYTQHVENGGTGTLIPKQDNDNSTNSTYEEGSQHTINNYMAEQAFELAEKNAKLEKLLLYYRMKTEPEVVEKEIELLKKELTPENE